MRAIDIIEYSLSDFASNKFKTMMSSLGIIIGVMAIVTILTLGDGMYSGVSQQFGSLDLDQISVSPGGGGGGMTMGGMGMQQAVSKPSATLTDRDARMLKSTSGVAEVNPHMAQRATGTYGGQNSSFTVQGVVPAGEEKLSRQMDKGRFLSPSDTYSVVIGSNVSNGTFKRNILPGMTITLTSPQTGMAHAYTVVGVLQESKGSVVTGDPNLNVYTTVAGMKGISRATSYNVIYVRAESSDTVDQTVSSIKDTLGTLHRNEGFSVTSAKSISDQLTVIFTYIKYILGGIAAISLVVGGIGILNVMMLTVRERTKEIGLMKAVGATTGNVRLLFLAESSMLGIVSGLIGLAMAFIVAMVIGNLAGMQMPISLQNIAVGLGFGFITTTIAGMYPANQAATMDPIEALRTE